MYSDSLAISQTGEQVLNTSGTKIPPAAAENEKAEDISEHSSCSSFPNQPVVSFLDDDHHQSRKQSPL